MNRTKWIPVVFLLAFIGGCSDAPAEPIKPELLIGVWVTDNGSTEYKADGTGVSTFSKDNVVKFDYTLSGNELTAKLKLPGDPITLTSKILGLTADKLVIRNPDSGKDDYFKRKK